MSIPPSYLEELRERLPVSAVVGRRVRLQRKGRTVTGLCPFHDDTKPSMNVVDDKGFYHCFACGAHGDIISFAMETEGLSFPEAVERLAALAGLPPPPRADGEEQRAGRRQKLLAAVETACRWYQSQLRQPAGAAALRYLRDRGLDDAAIDQFRLGYAPPRRGALLRDLTARGIDAGLLAETGLVRQAEGREESWEFFRDRVMFPIADRMGRVIAFGGRSTGDGQPKYLNSPDTPLFHKRRVLFGLAQAREGARKHGRAILVEGYMDVIALHAAGLPVAVAPLGTALTEDQLAALWRLAEEPAVCFDGDAAGRRAALRAADIALPMLAPGRTLMFAELPQGEDPDDIVRRHGAAGMTPVLEAAVPLSRMVWDAELAVRPVDTPERRADLRRRLDARVRQVADRMVQQELSAYFRDCWAASFRSAGAGPGDAAPDRARASRGGGWRPVWRRPEPPHPSLRFAWRHAPAMPGRLREARRGAGGADTRRRREQVILATVLNHPELLAEHDEMLAGLPIADPELDRLRQAMLELAVERGEAAAETLGDLVAARFPVLAGRLTAGLSDLYGFAAPDAGHARARRGWLDLCNRYRAEALRAEIETLQVERGDSFTDSDMAALRDMQAELRRLGDVDPDAPP